ncbi:MAG: AAA family ATPase, partial [Planctomycetaceae bacterium]|nr:AAA family ATPase [Planctomycetaceae bacterium]
MFARHEMTEEQLIDDFDCLGGLERTSTPPTPIRRSLNYEYRYDPDQETKLHAGSSCYFSHDLTRKVTIDSLEPSHGLVELTVGPNFPAPPQRLSLIPDDYISANVIADAVYRYVEAWSQGTILSQAVDDLLHRRKPRIRGHRQGPLVPQGAELLASTIDLVQRMDRTVLCIQGPPGTGKTYTAAHAILAVLRQGKSVGVTANSHKAILNVLRGVHVALQEAGENFRIIKAGNPADEPLIASGEIELFENSGLAVAELNGEPLVLGGTAWLFSRPDIAGRLDYLFVDEAGQFSLANTVGVGLAAENLVLVGDQMQLGQPTLGSHPGRSGESALNYLLDGQATIPPDLGVLLDQTWRLHPGICRFISEAFYDGRLQSHPQTNKQKIKTPGPLITRESGVVFMPVPHYGNVQGSQEEVEAVANLIDELLGSSAWSGQRKSAHPLGWEDILVVAPFNYQVRLLQETLGPDARVGTVDKFQGQEADVVIVSLASSTIEDSPRGAEFLLEPNRLNVAVSRAKSLAIVVGNPGLISGRLTSIRSMELANLFCWLVDYAGKDQ